MYEGNMYKEPLSLAVSESRGRHLTVRAFGTRRQDVVQ